MFVRTVPLVIEPTAVKWNKQNRYGNQKLHLKLLKSGAIAHPPNWCIFTYESPLCLAIRNFKVKAKAGVLLHYKPEFPWVDFLVELLLQPAIQVLAGGWLRSEKKRELQQKIHTLSLQPVLVIVSFNVTLPSLKKKKFWPQIIPKCNYYCIWKKKSVVIIKHFTWRFFEARAFYFLLLI